MVSEAERSDPTSVNLNADPIPKSPAQQAVSFKKKKSKLTDQKRRIVAIMAADRGNNCEVVRHYYIFLKEWSENVLKSMRQTRIISPLLTKDREAKAKEQYYTPGWNQSCLNG